MSLPTLLANLVAQEDLSDEQMTLLMHAIMTGEATEAQIGFERGSSWTIPTHQRWRS